MESRPSAVRVIFCERQRRWLPVENHMECDYCAAPVFDENDEPVSFLCTQCGERRVFQPEHTDPSEEGYGAPSGAREAG